MLGRLMATFLSLYTGDQGHLPVGRKSKDLSIS